MLEDEERMRLGVIPLVKMSELHRLAMLTAKPTDVVKQGFERSRERRCGQSGQDVQRVMRTIL